jgi:transmembrane sensor
MENKYEDSALSQAARWYARLRAPDCSAADRADFERWLAVAAEHARAYDAAVRTAVMVAAQARSDPRLKALAQAALELAPDVPDQARTRRTSRRLQSRAAALWLGGILAITLFAAQWLGGRGLAPAAVAYANNGLQEQRLQLDDGSIVHLDVGGELRVALSRSRRELTLLHGRAYFEVAHDKARPFVVAADGTQTTALGTQFEVELRPGAVAVTLAQGSVEVLPTARTAGWHEVLKPGQQLRIDTLRQEPERMAVNATRVSSWAQGRLEFDGVPLSQALEQFNRYSQVKIRLGDESLADFPLGGTFVAGSDSAEFVAALSMLLPLRSVRTDAGEIVLFQGYGNELH